MLKFKEFKILLEKKIFKNTILSNHTFLIIVSGRFIKSQKGITKFLKSQNLKSILQTYKLNCSEIKTPCQIFSFSNFITFNNQLMNFKKAKVNIILIKNNLLLFQNLSLYTNIVQKDTCILTTLTLLLNLKLFTIKKLI